MQKKYHPYAGKQQGGKKDVSLGTKSVIIQGKEEKVTPDKQGK